jgi:hypothetical protein
VSAASAMRCALGGGRAAKCDRHSERIEGYRSVILMPSTQEPPSHWANLPILHTFAPSTVWRFLDRHAMTQKKRTQPSRMCRKPILGGIVFDQIAPATRARRLERKADVPRHNSS